MQPGELIPLGDKSEGGQKTLFETYNFGTWQLDSELTFPGDTVQIAFYGITQFLMYLLLLVVYMTMGLTWWLFSAMSVPGPFRRRRRPDHVGIGVSVAVDFPDRRRRRCRRGLRAG